MKVWILIFGVAMGVLAVGGCTQMQADGTRMFSANKAECLVCKHNADLACVDIEVKKETPRAEYQGKTYYFCSDACREKFEKEPQKYVAAGH